MLSSIAQSPNIRTEVMNLNLKTSALFNFEKYHETELFMKENMSGLKNQFDSILICKRL